MNTIPEDMTLDVPEESDYVRPLATFKGKDLWPLTVASELLFIQIRTPSEDTRAYEGLAFVYLHLKRGGKTFKEDRAQITPLCWDINRFRETILEWVESEKISSDERLEAVRIYREAFDKARKSEVEPVPSLAQKKTEDQSPTAPLFSSGS